jgi:hypothetical protein
VVTQSEQQIRCYLQSLDWDMMFTEIIKSESSPGYPYSLISKKNKVLLESYAQLIIDIVIDRFIKLINVDPINLKDNNYCLQNNLVDPVRLFVKNEPHKSSKILEGKLRLISSVSIADQIIERLLHTKLNQAMIYSWRSIPSKPGIGLTTDSDFAQIVTQFAQLRNPCSSDVIGWDWSVQEQELLYNATFRAEVLGLPMEHPFIKVMLNRQHLVANSIYALSDGTLFSSDEDAGIQLSGCYITSSGNSEIRILNTHLVAAIDIIVNELNISPREAIEKLNANPKYWVAKLPFSANMAMGDDCLEEYHSTAYLTYPLLGHPLKFIDIIPPDAESFEFCSNTIEISNKHYLRHYSSQVGKSLFNLLHQPEVRTIYEILDTFLESIRHHPDRDNILDYLRLTQWSSLMVPTKN